MPEGSRRWAIQLVHHSRNLGRDYQSSRLGCQWKRVAKDRLTKVDRRAEYTIRSGLTFKAKNRVLRTGLLPAAAYACGP